MKPNPTHRLGEDEGRGDGRVGFPGIEEKPEVLGLVNFSVWSG